MNVKNEIKRYSASSTFSPPSRCYRKHEEKAEVAFTTTQNQGKKKRSAHRKDMSQDEETK